MTAQLNKKLVTNGESVQTLADVLVSLGLLDVKKADQVKFTEVQTGKPQESIINDLGLVDETALTA